MPPQEIVHKQATKILLNHAQLAMVMWKKLQLKGSHIYQKVSLQLGYVF